MLSFFRTPDRTKESMAETFVTPRASFFSSENDVTPKQEPKSPEKFSEDCSASFTPIVQLEKIETETGEENEVVLFCDKAKLYRYDSEGRQWKERGIGDLKILENVKSQSVRMIMRRDQVKKICLNHSIISGMNLEFMPNRRNTLIWFTHADYADEEVRAEKFAARFKSEEVMKKFKECFDSVLKEGRSSFNSPKEVKEEARAEDLAQHVEVEPAIASKHEVGKQEGNDKLKKADVVDGNDKIMESSSTVQSIGSFESFFSENQGSDNSIAYPQQSSNQETHPVPPVTSSTDTTTLHEIKSTPMFSFSTNTLDKRVEAKTKFSWPISGTQSLFSIGTIDGSTNTSINKDVTDSHASSEIALDSVSSDNQSFSFSDFSWSKSNSTKGPFSFSFSTSKAVEDIPNGTENRDSKREGPSFSLSGLGSNNGAPLFSHGLAKENASNEVEKEKGDSLQPGNSGSPEKVEDKEIYDPSEAIVTLERVESSTGEESETAAFMEWAKAYRFDSEAKQWKERGSGDIKILRHNATGQYRLLMRRDQVKKIAINHFVTKEMKLEPGKTAKNSWVWFTSADFSDEVAKPEKFTIRFRSEEISKRFKSTFDDAVKNLCDRLNVDVVSKDERTESPTKSEDISKADNIAVDKSTETFADVVITYVKESTNEEREHAERLLLPCEFFAPASKIPRWKQKEEKCKASTTVKQSDHSQDAMSFTTTSNGLSFADLVSQSSASVSGFGSSPDKQDGFKGQGSVLFGKKEDENETADGDDYLSFKPIVSLTKTETKTGEEEEEEIFAERCKLYRLDKDSNQWKERGMGDMKILYNSKQKTWRIIMRRDVVFKLGANHLILPGMNVKSKEGRETTWMWKTNADIADDVPREETFTVRFRTAETGRRFAEVFEECLAKARKEGLREEISEEDGKVMQQMPSTQLPVALVEKPSQDEGYASAVLSGNQIDLAKRTITIENDPSDAFLGNQGDSQDNLNVIKSVEPTVEKEKVIGSTFGSQFHGLDFSALAKSDSNAFQHVSKGEFANTGAKLFESGAECTEGQNPRSEAIVRLEQVETKSGEEDEDVLFENNIKLYRFSKETKEWKERGVGVVKLLRHKSTKVGRLIMRRNIVLKIAANHALTEGMKLDMTRSSSRTLAWTAFADVSDDKPSDSMFAAKFKSDDVMREFSRVFEALCSGEEVELSDEAKEADGPKDIPATGCCGPELKQELQTYLDREDNDH